MSLEHEPSWFDWQSAKPAPRGELHAKHFAIGRERIEQAFADGSNIHGRSGCPCMGCSHGRTRRAEPRATEMWKS